jgi:RNase H-fold protein (predicted Holliday junction resolvase)
MMDERLTSWQAEREMEEQFGRKSKASGITSKKKTSEKVSVDSMAAAIILRDYLAHRRDKTEGGEK